MRNPILPALVAVLCAAGSAVAATPVTGMWRTPVKNSIIDIYDCGAYVCGRVVSSDDLRGNPNMRDAHNSDAALQSRPIKGLVMMTGFKGGPTEWTGGTLYDPSSGHSYHGSIDLVSADTLKLKGCIVAPLCRTQSWTRVH